MWRTHAAGAIQAGGDADLGIYERQFSIAFQLVLNLLCDPCIKYHQYNGACAIRENC